MHRFAVRRRVGNKRREFPRIRDDSRLRNRADLPRPRTKTIAFSRITRDLHMRELKTQLELPSKRPVHLARGATGPEKSYLRQERERESSGRGSGSKRVSRGRTPYYAIAFFLSLFPIHSRILDTRARVCVTTTWDANVSATPASNKIITRVCATTWCANMSEIYSQPGSHTGSLWRVISFLDISYYIFVFVFFF